MIGRILQGLPDWVLSVMSAVSGVAFLAGPLALVFLSPHRWVGGLQRFYARLLAATLLSLLAVTAALVAGTASLVQVFLVPSPQE